jgi:hypothetical protein
VNTDSCSMQRKLFVEGEDPHDAMWRKPVAPGDYVLCGEASTRYLYLHLPSGGRCLLPIARAGEAHIHGGGAVWQWDGNEDAPTLEPSVWHMPRSGEPKEWHGWIRAGRMESC